MEVSLEIKEEIRKTQSDLKKALHLHQIWVGRLKDDETNPEIRSRIKQAECNIVLVGQTQKKVIEKLRNALMVHQDSLKAHNKLVNSEYDNRHIALQLRDHQLQHRSKKKAISLLKPSVLNELNDKSDSFDKLKSNHYNDNNETSYNKHNEEMDDDSEFIHATENFSLKDTPMSRSSAQDRRTNISNNIIKKVKQKLCSSIEVSLKPSTSPKSSSSKSSSVSPVREDLSPTPSPPLHLPLPSPGDDLSQETFLRVVGLITPRQRQLLEKKQKERKKRSTTSTNKNEFVYGSFDKRKKANFPYLQQNVPPPQTRSQKMKRQQLAARRTVTNVSPVASPAASPTIPWPASLTLPSGLTIQAVSSPSSKQCSVCRKNDTSSSLLQCARCKNNFHTSCASSPSSRSPSSRSRSPLNTSDRRYKRPGNICPECGEEYKEPKFNNWTVISKGYSNSSGEERALKERLLEKKLLHEKNKQLSVDLRRLEVRAESLKENIEASNIEKKQLISNQNNTRKRIKLLLDFVNTFKDPSETLCLVMGDKDSSRSTNDTDEFPNAY